MFLLILTPVVLLGVVALFGFVGCGFQPGRTTSLSTSPPEGLSFGGTSVTITAKNEDFAAITQVTFSSPGFSSTATIISQPGTADMSGDQTFTVISPPYSGPINGSGATVDIVIDYIETNNHNYTATAAGAFTYFPPVTHVQTVANGTNAGNTITAAPLNLQGGELILGTVQWAGPATPTPTLADANFQPVPSAGPFAWSGMNVQCFYAINVVSGQLAVSVTLGQNSSAPWTLCVSAYDFADAANPTYSPSQGNPNFKGTNPSAPGISANPGDVVYAVAYAADPGGPFPGSNSLSAGTGFNAESGAIAYLGGGTTMNPLVEDAQVMAAATIIPAANNTTSNTNPRGWIFGFGIKVAKT